MNLLSLFRRLAAATHFVADAISPSNDGGVAFRSEDDSLRGMGHLCLVQRMTRRLACAFSMTWLAANLAAQTPEPSAPPVEIGAEGSGEVENAPAATSAARPIEVVNDPVAPSIVKITATIRRPDVLKPWNRTTASEVSGSGVVIEGKRILTCAHVVLNATEVLVQASQSSERVSARVEFIAPGMDLAVLRLDDESFFDTHPALPLETTPPPLKSPVLAYGFPKGGTALAITKGIVSRVEFVRYSSVSGLRVQIDAPINPGSSGGPALAGGRVVGLSNAGVVNAQNIGYVIPAEEIALFLADTKDGKYDGKPALFDRFQPLEQTGLRSALNVPAKLGGVVVTATGNSVAGYPLRAMDVITHVAGVPLDVQGYVKVGDLRVAHSYLVQKHTREDRVAMTLWREGHEVTVEVPVEHSRAQVIADFSGRPLPYFVYGPFVFSVVSTQFVQTATNPPRAEQARTILSWVMSLSTEGSPVLTRLGDRPDFPGEELVMLCGRPLSHRLSRGAPPSVFGQALQTVNGVKVRNLAHLVELLRDSTAPQTVFVFSGTNAPVIAVPHAEALAATEEILVENSIRTVASPELLKLWGARPPAALKDSSGARAKAQL